jgi:hypothetical protein
MEGKTKIVGGSRDVQPGIASVERAQIATLLKEQRKSIIDSMKNNLPVYLNYKFSQVATDIQLNQIRAALIAFDQSPITDAICEATRLDPLYGFNSFYYEANRIIGAIIESTFPQ